MQDSDHLDDSISRRRVRCIEICQSFIYNSVPLYLIRIPNNSTETLRITDLKLITREHLWELMQPQVEAIPDADLSDIPLSKLDVWCQNYARGLIKFAIFSHRWGRGEPKFHNIRSDRYVNEPAPLDPLPEGYRKLLKFCEKAMTDFKCFYIWSDTCCINKESSSELEEAIRSMYRWYRDAEVCIAYLGESSMSSFKEDFKTERWFKRGWTLQELLAPRRLKFYGKDWEPIFPSAPVRNDKDDEAARSYISDATGIPEADIHTFSPSCDRISEKMRWMSKRQTTKIEDIAYSLLGIFDVTMPVSYGEDAWAFHRLMEVLAERSWDPSFLAWAGRPSPYSNALPGSPQSYLLDSDRQQAFRTLGEQSLSSISNGPCYILSKIGLQFAVLIVPVDGSVSPFSPCSTYALFLRSKKAIAIPLQAPRMTINATRIRSATSESEYALGVISFLPGDGGSGRLRAKGRYLSVLLKKVGGAWNKEKTKEVVVLNCEQDWQGKSESLTWKHKARRAPVPLS